MTMTADHGRDNFLTGADTERAVVTGLAKADWYHTEMPRKVMKEPSSVATQRSSHAGLRRGWHLPRTGGGRPFRDRGVTWAARG